MYGSYCSSKQEFRFGGEARIRGKKETLLTGTIASERRRVGRGYKISKLVRIRLMTICAQRCVL